ncbi:helix-turn-helix domain-containing protein [Bradyrhizobium sp. Leo121]|uniref:helix-turn-helix domain-containing protein n=1 Tax=Bradyrhizobium sp. Leo121 TaxID=1571195 RepID=UPI00102A190B|nr:helix-turn-helix domain-containing protein [Bradyrhizobium sp. Leo121]RZN19485.1 hypothetical protein CWO90_35230 [Bradyrhizobium sp. Leo121]
MDTAWSANEDAILLELRGQGRSYLEIGEKLSRSLKSCERRWYRVTRPRDRKYIPLTEKPEDLRDASPKQNAKATNKLLVLLREHHDFNIQVPKNWKPKPAKPVMEEMPKPPPALSAAFQKWLDKFEPMPEPSYPPVQSIKKRVAEHFGISVLDLDSARRHAKVCVPRQIAIYLSKNLTPRSYPDIGSKFGGRDHCTVIHAVRKIERLVKEDWRVAFDVAHIEAALS